MWRADSLEKTLMLGDWRQEEKGTTEDEMVEWHHWLSGCESEQTLGDTRGQKSLECYSPWGHKTQTWLSDWTRTAILGWLKSLLRFGKSRMNFLGNPAQSALKLELSSWSPWRSKCKTLHQPRHMRVLQKNPVPWEWSHTKWLLSALRYSPAIREDPLETITEAWDSRVGQKRSLFRDTRWERKKRKRKPQTERNTHMRKTKRSLMQCVFLKCPVHTGCLSEGA